MLWTNEIKDTFEQSLENILAMFEEKYIKVIMWRKSQFRDTYPKLSIIATPMIDVTKEYAHGRYASISNKVEQISDWLVDLCRQYNCEFIPTKDLETWADGVHLSEGSHQKLAELIYMNFK